MTIVVPLQACLQHHKYFTFILTGTWVCIRCTVLPELFLSRQKNTTRHERYNNHEYQWLQQSCTTSSLIPIRLYNVRFLGKKSCYKLETKRYWINTSNTSVVCNYKIVWNGPEITNYKAYTCCSYLENHVFCITSPDKSMCCLGYANLSYVLYTTWVERPVGRTILSLWIKQVNNCSHRLTVRHIVCYFLFKIKTLYVIPKIMKT